MENLFLILGVAFAVIMVILLFKYAKFISTYPKMGPGSQDPESPPENEKSPLDKE